MFYLNFQKIFRFSVNYCYLLWRYSVAEARSPLESAPDLDPVIEQKLINEFSLPRFDLISIKNQQQQQQRHAAINRINIFVYLQNGWKV